MRYDVELPDKPSALIRLSLSDLKACEKAGYDVDMGSWHIGATWLYGEETKWKPCAVCLAGALMAQSLGLDNELTRSPMDFDTKTEKVLCAIDAFRGGYIASGFIYLGLDRPNGVKSWMNVERYAYRRETFFSDMEAMAAHLEEHGV